MNWIKNQINKNTNNKFLFFAYFFGLFLVENVSAQNTKETMGLYRSAVGVRFSNYSGITVRHLMNARNGFDAQFIKINQGLWFQLHWFKQKAFFIDKPNLNLFYGGGLHFGANPSNKLQFGPALNSGIDYLLKDLPIGATLDIIPTLDLSSGNSIFSLGLTVRYVLN